MLRQKTLNLNPYSLSCSPVTCNKRLYLTRPKRYWRKVCWTVTLPPTTVGPSHECSLGKYLKNGSTHHCESFAASTIAVFKALTRGTKRLPVGFQHWLPVGGVEREQVLTRLMLHSATQLQAAESAVHQMINLKVLSEPNSHTEQHYLFRERSNHLTTQRCLKKFTSVLTFLFLLALFSVVSLQAS